MQDNKLDYRKQLEDVAAPSIKQDPTVEKDALLRKTNQKSHKTKTERIEDHIANELSAITGKANSLTDKELIRILKLPPKSVPEIKTKSNFQKFFRGIAQERLRRLLEKAYEDQQTAEERTSRVEKRLSLMEGLLS